MKAFTIVSLILYSLACHAQDYAVTTKKDTVRGKVVIHSYSKLDQVQITEQKKKREIAATSLLMISIDSQIYRPVLVTDGYRMLKLSKPGLLSVYLGRQAPGTPFNVPYLVKNSGQAIEVPNLRFKKQMTEFLSDCHYIKQKIEDDKLKRQDLDAIIEEYNKCIESQTHLAFLPSEDSRLEAITAFKVKLEKDSATPPDAIEVLKDLYSKVKEKKQVPKYLTDSLREMLKDLPAYQSDLDSLLEKLKD